MKSRLTLELEGCIIQIEFRDIPAERERDGRGNGHDYDNCIATSSSSEHRK